MVRNLYSLLSILPLKNNRFDTILYHAFFLYIIKLVGDMWYNQVDNERDDYNEIQN